MNLLLSQAWDERDLSTSSFELNKCTISAHRNVFHRHLANVPPVLMDVGYLGMSRRAAASENNYRNKILVPLAGIEPALLAELDFESSASTSSATGAFGRGPERPVRRSGRNIAGGLRGSTRADVIMACLDTAVVAG